MGTVGSTATVCDETESRHKDPTRLMAVAQRLAAATTRLPPCCLQVCGDFVYIGTYDLDKGSGERHGSVDTYLSDGLTLVESIDTNGAVLDIKVSPHDEHIVATAHSTGEVAVWRHDEALRRLQLVATHQLFDRHTLVTSLVFLPVERDQLLVTLTTGELAVVNHALGTVVQTMAAQHSLECWTGHYGEVGHMLHVAFTGGDDARLIAHDLRTAGEVWRTGTRHHTAGVVSVLGALTRWNHARPHQLWTGLYDDHLRVLDLRLVDRARPALISGYPPLVLYEENLGGGVWRLVPRGDDAVLACCMYDGARIVRPTETSFDVERYFKGDHESMCYGGDWTQGGAEVVTCSFYDKVVQAWSPSEVQA